MSSDRHSVAHSVELITDPDEKAKREVENGFRQFARATEIIKEHVQDGERPFKISQRHVLELNSIALDGIHPMAGTYRNTPVEISKSKHQPPEHYLVADLVVELCDYINKNFDSTNAIHLGSYVLWRLNWIHPFADGNGRTSRILMYIVLSIRQNSLLPGTPTIPDQIADDKKPYYSALESADEAFLKDSIDLSEMEKLLSGMLARQLANAIEEATQKNI